MSEIKFDPNSEGIRGKLFGLPYTTKEADIIVVPVPWEVTVSYGEGTGSGPRGILEASSQIDLNHFFIAEPWRIKTAITSEQFNISSKSESLRKLATRHIEDLESGRMGSSATLDKVNDGGEWLNQEVESIADKVFESSKIPVFIGGDHSISLGCIKSHMKSTSNLGVLQIDAHADLRPSYEGFQYSHASVMYNVLKETEVQKLVQVGVRDYCQQEEEYIRQSDRVSTFFDAEFKTRRLNNDCSWADYTKEVLKELPDDVYISLDIDGMNPSLCPNTGTPVPGGLSFEELVFLLSGIVRSGRRIVGFDLVEVSGQGQWDVNVGARVLFELILHTGVSKNLLKWK